MQKSERNKTSCKNSCKSHVSLSVGQKYYLYFYYRLYKIFISKTITMPKPCFSYFLNNDLIPCFSSFYHKKTDTLSNNYTLVTLIIGKWKILYQSSLERTFSSANGNRNHWFFLFIRDFLRNNITQHLFLLTLGLHAAFLETLIHHLQ